MQLASLLLVTSLFAPGQAQSPAAGDSQPAVTADVSAAPAPSAQGLQPLPTPAQGAQIHTFGVGASFAVSNYGLGGSFRYWFGQHVGLDTTVSWSHGYYPSTAGGQSPSLFMAQPSVIILLGQQDPTRSVNFRPYLGGGVTYAYRSQPYTTVSSISTSGVGPTVFGGVETTFRDYNQMAVSAQLIYSKLPASITTTRSYTTSGLDFLVAVHFYLK